ncbi:transcriptional regulator family: Fungal Specific TF [Aspergillus niger]|nr:transcriptional regulator family: Fungal Specific TF [Aspergillus niger]
MAAPGTGDLGYDHDNLRHVVITATCFALVLSTVSVGLRLYCRKITGTKVFFDDYLIIVALVFEYAVSLAGVVSSGSFLYTLCIAFTKLSILALYKRIFSIRPMILAANAVGATVILWCFGVCLIGGVVCIPLEKLWNPTIPGGCIDLAKFYYGLQIPNIVTDAVILALPLKHVWNLQVPRAEKIMLTGIFCLGALTLAFDIVRLVTLIELSKSGNDITYDQVPASVWTCIEPAVGITASCLSNMRPLFLALTRLRVRMHRVLSRPSQTGSAEIEQSKIVFTQTVRVNSSHTDQPSDMTSRTAPYAGRPSPLTRPAKSEVQELLDRCRYMEQILKHTIEGIALDTKSLARLANSFTTGKSSDHPEVISPAGMALEEEDCTIDPVGDTTTHFSGEFSYWNFSMRIKQRIQSRMRTKSPDRVSGYWRAQHLKTNEHLSAALACFPPRPITGFLVKTFLKYAATHWFLVEEDWLLDRAHRLYTDPASLGDTAAAVASILLSVLAIGTQYAHLESPSDRDPKNQTPSFSEEDVGVRFYEQSIRLLPEIIELSCLESVQACLLLGFYALPVDASGLGYIYINLAVRLAMQNGMHRKCRRDAFSPVMMETRNRVWWTAYSLERLISIFHGRPLSVHRADVDADLPHARGDMGQAQSTWSSQCAVISIRMLDWLEEFLHDISRLRHAQPAGLPVVIGQLIARKESWDRWWAGQSDALVNSIQPGHQPNRAVMHLCLESCLLRMFIGRPFLLRKDTPSHPNANPQSSSEETYFQPSDRDSLIGDCIQAAQEALGICRQLRDHGSGLARASYLEYSACRAALLVLIAFSVQNLSDALRQPMREGLVLLREMSAAGDSARSEVSLLEALERSLARLHTVAQRPEPAAESTGLVSDYEAFRNWGTTCKKPASEAAPPHPDTVEPWTVPLDGMEQLPPYDPALDLSIFGGANLSPSATWPTRTETQVLEEFLAGSSLDPIWTHVDLP